MKLKDLFNTVFNRIDNREELDKTLAIIFHRVAVVTYVIYFLWGLLTLIFASVEGVNATFSTSIFGISFPLIIAGIALCAAVGALYFPKHARLEMYASAAFITLLLAYLTALLTTDILEGEINKIPGVVLLSLVLVVPVARIRFVYRALVEAATKKKEPKEWTK